MSLLSATICLVVMIPAYTSATQSVHNGYRRRPIMATQHSFKDLVQATLGFAGTKVMRSPCLLSYCTGALSQQGLSNLRVLVLLTSLGKGPTALKLYQ